MRKPYISNIKLNKIYNEEQNKYMLKKLGKTKASINNKCPESYTFYSTFHKPEQSKDLLGTSKFYLYLNLKLYYFFIYYSETFSSR